MIIHNFDVDTVDKRQPKKSINHEALRYTEDTKG